MKNFDINEADITKLDITQFYKKELIDVLKKVFPNDIRSIDDEKELIEIQGAYKVIDFLEHRYKQKEK